MSVTGFTCPVCSRTSANTSDAAEGYCGACQGYTTMPPPPGFRWVKFTRKAWPSFGRLLEERWLEPGYRYEMVGEGDVFVYDGAVFVEVEE